MLFDPPAVCIIYIHIHVHLIRSSSQMENVGGNGCRRHSSRRHPGGRTPREVRVK